MDIEDDTKEMLKLVCFALYPITTVDDRKLGDSAEIQVFVQAGHLRRAKAAFSALVKLLDFDPTHPETD